MSLMLFEPLNELLLGDDVVPFEEGFQRIGNLITRLPQQLCYIVPT